MLKRQAKKKNSERLFGFHYTYSSEFNIGQSTTLDSYSDMVGGWAYFFFMCTMSSHPTVVKIFPVYWLINDF